MDRRDFFKSLFMTPLITPILLASKRGVNDAQLYLISDSPDLNLPPLLEELRTLGLVYGNTYLIHDPKAQEGPLHNALRASGLIPARPGEKAHMTVSSSPLASPARPSFTLARGGKVWDLRSSTLLNLWSEMNRLGSRSNRMTVLSFHPRPSERMSGKTVSFYRDGKKIKTVSLRQDFFHSFQGGKGEISVRVKDGQVWVPQSSCRFKICTHCAPVSYAGERIICAPNHFLLEVDGPSPVDAIIG